MAKVKLTSRIVEEITNTVCNDLQLDNLQTNDVVENVLDRFENGEGFNSFDSLYCYLDGYTQKF